PVIAVAGLDRLDETVLGADGIEDPAACARDGFRELFVGAGGAERGPAQGGGGQVAAADGGVAPPAVRVGVGGEPFEAALDEVEVACRVFAAVDLAERDGGDGGGEGAGSEEATPAALASRFGEEVAGELVQRGAGAPHQVVHRLRWPSASRP